MRHEKITRRKNKTGFPGNKGKQADDKRKQADDKGKQADDKGKVRQKFPEQNLWFVKVFYQIKSLNP